MSKENDSLPSLDKPITKEDIEALNRVLSPGSFKTKSMHFTIPSTKYPISKKLRGKEVHTIVFDEIDTPDSDFDPEFMPALKSL